MLKNIFLINFWDVLYLLFIIGVAMIWAPGESTFLYASYNQPSNLGDGKTGDDGPDGPDTVDEAFEDEDYITKPDTVGIEMTNTSNKEESTTVKPKSTSSSTSSSKPSTSTTTIKKSMTAPPAKGVRPAGVLVEVEDEDDDFADEFPPVQQQRTSDNLTGKLNTSSSSTSSSRGIDTRTLAPPRDLKLKK